MHIVCGLKSPVYLAMTKVMSNIRGKAVNCIGWLEEEEEEGGEIVDAAASAGANRCGRKTWVTCV